jgi:hypothetical protein
VRIILSRKGFDSSAGGVASPILPDGRLISIPIPDPDAPFTYKEWQVTGIDAGQLVHDLTRGKVTARHKMHLDPDLRSDSLLTRDPTWKPIFGQHGAAGGHLIKHQVGPDDLFVFFGWFREVENHQGRWRFKKGAPDLHILHGWLKIETVYNPPPEAPPAWMKHHPHFFGNRAPNNLLYVARDNFSIDDQIVPGAGHFNFHKPELVLTKAGQNRGIWSLPRCFFPQTQDEAMTYHQNLSRWEMQKDYTVLDSAKRGQEFIIEIRKHNQDILNWFESLISTETLQTL